MPSKHPCSNLPRMKRPAAAMAQWVGEGEVVLTPSDDGLDDNGVFSDSPASPAGMPAAGAGPSSSAASPPPPTPPPPPPADGQGDEVVAFQFVA